MPTLFPFFRRKQGRHLRWSGVSIQVQQFMKGVSARAVFFLGGFVLLLALRTPAAQAQSGKLSGRVTDGAGQPIIGATVLVVGTTLGAAADLNGDYAIIRVPPGTYTVRFSSVGYQTKIVEEVRISSNQTTTLDATLPEEVVEGEEVVVTAERPIVDVTLTSSMATLAREEIELLPVQQLDEIVNLQAGVVDGHFRGGRVGEVQYQVDGVSVNNPYDNSSTLELDRSVLQEVQIISGTFDAEYGQALSGVVNAVLRTGDMDRYEFTFETYIGEYFSPGNDSTTARTFFDGQEQVAEVAFLPYIGEIDPLTIQNYQFSLSGPMPLAPNTTFLVNGQRFVDMGYLLGRRVFNPTDSIDVGNNVFFPTGDNELVSLEFEKRWSWLGKITNRSIPNVLLSYQAVGGYEERQGESGRSQAEPNYTYRFNPDGIKTKSTLSLVHGVDLTHTLSDRLFYELSLRQNYFDYRDYKYEDAFDPRYFEAGQPIQDEDFERGAVLTGVNLGRFVQKTNAFVFKGSMTSQVTKVHLGKAGIELQVSNLDFGTPGRIQPIVIGGIQQLGVVTDTLGAEVLSYHPVQGAAFAQDRVEWGDLRVRAGLRLEYFDANSTTPSDLANPANSIDGAPESRPVNTSIKLTLAPRVGFSFPILGQASLFFSYGHFYQMPGLGQLFSNADYSVLEDLQDSDEARGQIGILGNPDLKPEFTAQYEFGFKSEITRWLGLDVSLFYKDIRDLLGVEFVQTYTAAQYARFTNVDFGGVRGFTISLDQRGLGAISTTLDYTYQTATGNSSDPRETFNRAQAGEDPLPRQIPFNWDQRHTLNATAVWFQPNNFALTAILRLASGQPYTPTISTGFGAELESNSGRKDPYVLVDLRAEKFFRLGVVNLTAFARMFNLFDEHFANGFAYADTGSPFYTLNGLEQLNPNPGRLFPPRRLEIGLSLRSVVQR